MSFDRRPQYLQDVLDAIEAVREYTAGMDQEAYLADGKTQAAVERKLQILTEALIRIGRQEIQELCPGVDWLGARGLGNFLRHEYDRVESVRIWETVEDDLPELERAVQSAMRKLQARA